MDKKLVSYVQSTLHQGHSLSDVSERLRKEGWSEYDVQTALAAATTGHRNRAKFIVAITGFIAFLIIGILVYLLVIAPVFVEKPALEQPILLSQSTTPGVLFIDETHLAYVLNELGAYKLHANPFSGSIPELEIVLADIPQTYTATVEDNIVRVRKGPAQHPDVHVELTQDAVVTLTTAKDKDEMQARASQLLAERDQRGFVGELRTSAQDLLLKGYLALYKEQEATIEAAGITGGVAAEVPLAGSGLIGVYVLMLLLWYLVIFRMTLDR